MRLFEDVLLLPRLERVYGQCVDLDTRLATGTTLQGSLPPPNSSNVREVTLEYSLVEVAGFLDLLRTCPLLQTLRICWGDSIVGESQLAWDGFGDALREHGSNLELLDLDCRLDLGYEMGEWSGKIGDLSGKIGDLSGLRRLRHLSLPQDILLVSEDDLSGLAYLDDVDGDEAEDENDGPDVRLEPPPPALLGKPSALQRVRR
ncbi:hypothetical protein PG994_004414 [Apiospora phragmitis]|uniref:Uncharacterized protein n=1 Tax=Apiospora phragmitis TaxID=2905665 RepID=A0ABR1VQI7_9PEZI